jgi:hypothetical protein
LEYIYIKQNTPKTLSHAVAVPFKKVAHGIQDLAGGRPHVLHGYLPKNVDIMIQIIFLRCNQNFNTSFTHLLWNRPLWTLSIGQ